MLQECLGSASFWSVLFELDRRCAEQLRGTGCPSCDGKLDRGDYPRKPRGLPADAEEAFSKRFSFCCSRDGCRKRCTPPSVRFLGRKVYVGAIVLIASALACLVSAFAPLSVAPPKVPRRTVRRWLDFFQIVLVVLPFWQQARGRLMPPVNELHLPASLLERFAGDAAEQVVAALRFLSPITTTSCPTSSPMAA